MYKYRGWNIKYRMIDGMGHFVRWKDGKTEGYTSKTLLYAMKAIDESFHAKL